MKTSPTRQQVAIAVTAAEGKKAEDIAILQLDKASSAFTDYFVICSGGNPRQVQAIADDVELQLKRNGTTPNNVEGYNRAEWVLIDYVDFVVHVFSANARGHYNLERLWKSAQRLSPADLQKPESRVAAVAPRPPVSRMGATARTGAKKTASRRPSRATSSRTAAKKGVRGRTRTTTPRKKK